MHICNKISLGLYLEILRTITSADNSSLQKIKEPLIPGTLKSFTAKYYQFVLLSFLYYQLKSTEPSYNIISLYLKVITISAYCKKSLNETLNYWNWLFFKKKLLMLFRFSKFFTLIVSSGILYQDYHFLKNFSIKLPFQKFQFPFFSLKFCHLDFMQMFLLNENKFEVNKSIITSNKQNRNTILSIAQRKKF